MTPEPPAKGSSRRQFLRDLAAASIAAVPLALAGSEQPAAAGTGGGTPPALPPTPGSARSWHPQVGIYAGHANLASGNAFLQLPICSWNGRGGGLSFALVFNSQSTRSSALGAKWTYSYRMAVVGTNPAVVINDDGSEDSYTLSGGVYSPPVGVYDSRVKNNDSSWTLTKKGGTQYHFRSSDSMLSSIVDLNGNTISLTYTGSYLTTITDAASRTLTLGYTGALLTSITDCQSRVWTLGYTGSMVTSIAEPLLQGQSYTRQIGYDANGNLNSLSNKLGKTWQYRYGSNGILTDTIDPDNKTTSNIYGTALPPSLPSRPGAGPLTPSSWPTAVTTICSWTDANNDTTQYGLDTLGRHIATQDPSSNQTVYGYDTSNNRTSQQLPSGNTWQYQFDGRANPLVEQDPYGKQTIRTYGAFDLLATEKDALNNLTQRFYDANGNLTQVIDANNGSAVTVPNTDGSPHQVTDASGHVTRYGYDQWGHQSSITIVKDANTSFTISFVYTASSVLTQRTDALGRITNYTTDAWGRTTAMAYPTSGNPGIGLTLDQEGNLTQSSDVTGLRQYGYDSWNRCNSMIDPRGNTTAQYDGAGNLSWQTDVTGRKITYTPNVLNELTGVSDDNGATQASLTYTVDGRIWTATYQNGTKVTYGYDNAGRTNSLSHTVVSTGATLVSYTATYYNNGWLHAITEQPSGDVTTFSYDAVGNLSSEVRTGTKPYSGTYTYYADNQRKTAVVVTNGVTTHNGQYSYDGAGRLSQVIDSVTGLTEVYIWNNDGTLASAPGSGYTKLFFYNEERQLTTIQHNTNGTISTAYEYAYAADGGRRWRKDHLQNVWTWYPCGAACSAGALVEQTSDLTGQTWTTSASYLRTGGSCGSRLIRRVSNTDSEYHHFDPNANLAIVSGNTANVLATNLSDLFGVQRYTSGSAQTAWLADCVIQDTDGVFFAPVGQSGYLSARMVPLDKAKPACPCGCKGKKCRCHHPLRRCNEGEWSHCDRWCANNRGNDYYCCDCQYDDDGGYHYTCCKKRATA